MSDLSRLENADILQTAEHKDIKPKELLLT